MRKLLLLIPALFAGLLSINSIAQIRSPQPPTFETFQPTNFGFNFPEPNINNDFWNSPTPNYPMGTTDKDIINQINRQSERIMGIPNYRAGATPQENQRANEIFDEERRRNDPAYQIPDKSNGFYNLASQKNKEWMDLMGELRAADNEAASYDPTTLAKIAKIKRALRIADTSSTGYKTYSKYYYNAYSEILKMLSGKSPLSIKRAVFLVENAYYKNRLSYEKYCQQINSLASICLQVMSEKGLNPKNHLACHYTIQKLFSEKFTYKNTAGTEKTFEPFSYDFIDIFTDTNETKGFVTKLLNTKIGQCHSLPLLYLIIANELNANAFLAIAPNHSYIIFGNQNQRYGFETTNGTFTTDEWIVGSGYISPTAIKNQIYLAPLTKEEVVAECIVDLGNGLESLFGNSDFSIACANSALYYYPHCIGAILTINNVLVSECAQTASKYHFPKETEFYKYPDLKKQHDEMINYEMKVEQTGYQKIPPEQYIKWQQSANDEKQRREHLRLLSILQQSANEK